MCATDGEWEESKCSGTEYYICQSKPVLGESATPVRYISINVPLRKLEPLSKSVKLDGVSESLLGQ